MQSRSMMLYRFVPPPPPRTPSVRPLNQAPNNCGKLYLRVQSRLRPLVSSKPLRQEGKP